MHRHTPAVQTLDAPPTHWAQGKRLNQQSASVYPIVMHRHTPAGRTLDAPPTLGAQGPQGQISTAPRLSSKSLMPNTLPAQSPNKNHLPFDATIPRSPTPCHLKAQQSSTLRCKNLMSPTPCKVKAWSPQPCKCKTSRAQHLASSWPLGSRPMGPYESQGPTPALAALGVDQPSGAWSGSWCSWLGIARTFKSLIRYCIWLSMSVWRRIASNTLAPCAMHDVRTPPPLMAWHITTRVVACTTTHQGRWAKDEAMNQGFWKRSKHRCAGAGRRPDWVGSSAWGWVLPTRTHTPSHSSRPQSSFACPLWRLACPFWQLCMPFVAACMPFVAAWQTQVRGGVEAHVLPRHFPSSCVCKILRLLKRAARRSANK